MAPISRRTLLASALAAPLLIAGCASGTPRTVAETPPVPTEPPVETASLIVPGAFGPNGQHWPSRTPLRTDAFQYAIDVDPTWKAIGDAITKANAAGATKTAVIRVRPGVLPGNGAGSSSAPVLSNIGETGRSTRVLVVPRDGAGTVTLSNSIRFDRVRGVSFIGFWTYPYSVVFSAAQDFAWAWSKGQAFNISANSTEPTKNIELVECVTPDGRLTEGDVWGFRTAGQVMEGVSVIGCYLAPSFKPAGSDAHCDSLQFSGTHPVSGALIKDSVIFASTNAAVIPFDRAVDITFDRSLIVGGDRMLQRFPLPDEANQFTSGFPSAVNGSGTVDILSAQDSVFIGAMRGVWKSAVRSTVSLANPPKATSGSFTSDVGLSTIGPEWLDEQSPLPTDQRLLAIWK